MHPGPVTSDAPPAVGDGSEPRLTVAAAARRLGVAPSTLRTWDRRYGIGPSDHEAGRHRRYSPADLARLELMQHALLRGISSGDAARYARAARLPPAPAGGPPDRPWVVRPAGDPGVGPGGPPLLVAGEDGNARVRVGGRVLRLRGAGREARGFGRAALTLDAAAVRRLLREAVQRGGVAHAWDDVARPVLVAVGQRWADTGAGVEIEHLISEGVLAVFGMHAAVGPPADNPRPVLLAGTAGELHTLPLAVLGAALADRRVECRSLGPNLPTEALAAAVRRTAPAAVVLWSQSPPTADVELLRGLPCTRPRFRTFAAGPGWDSVALPPRVVLLRSLTHAEHELMDAVLS